MSGGCCLIVVRISYLMVSIAACVTMPAFFLLTENLARETISVDVGVADSIGDVKVKVEEKSGILAENQTLKIGDNKLEDSHNLNEYNINKMSTVHAVLRVLGSIEILVRNVNGKTFDIKVDAADTIETVKDKIFEKEGIPVKEQQLIFSGQDNVDDAALRRYIEKESTRHVFLRLIGVGRIHVDRVDHPSSPLVMEVDPSWAVKNITQLVTGNYGISSAQQQWLVASTAEELEDSRTFADYNVLKRSSLDMLLRVIGMIRITIQDMTGSTISIDCEPTDTLQKVRGKVQCRTGLPMEQVKVLYGDKALDGDGPLSELVTSRIDISAQLRLKGYVKVFVETQTAQAFVCHMLSSDTVIDLKREIKIASGITEEYQDLTYNGLEMADENSLRACFGDGHLDHYAVFLSHGDFLRVEVDGGASGKATVYVKNSDTVGSLKTKLHLEGGRHKDARVLYHNGKEMKDGESLRLFNPNGDFVIRLTMKLQMMHVNLHDVADNKIFAITLPKTSSMWEVKEAACKQGFRGTIFGRNRLRFNNSILPDGDTLLKCGVAEGQTLTCRTAA